MLASILGVAPECCVVFEDSVAGLTAAKLAGMQAIAVAHRCSDEEALRRIADRVVVNFEDVDRPLP